MYGAPNNSKIPYFFSQSVAFTFTKLNETSPVLVIKSKPINSSNLYIKASSSYPQGCFQHQRLVVLEDSFPSSLCIVVSVVVHSLVEVASVVLLGSSG